MSTPDDAVPPPAAPATPAPADTAPQSTDDLSPAVRRLVRQFDLDVTGIHGTGPSGRIRVSDVIGMLGGRTDSGNRDAAPRPPPPEYDDPPDTFDAAPEAASAESRAEIAPSTAALGAVPTTAVFDCDLGRVLVHRRRLRESNVDILLTSYFLTAVAEALPAAPELTGGLPARLGAVLSAGDGSPRTSLVDSAASDGDAVLEQRLRSVDAALRANLDSALADANLLVFHYGESGSLLTTPTPLAAEHAASIGIGRVRREIVVRSVDGTESPRVAARCYVTASFRPERVEPHRTHRFLAHAVRVLEQWPD